MIQDYKLHLQVGNGPLRLTPKGPLSARTVEQLLGVARSALTFFSMLTMDLREAWEVREVYLALLEKGLQQLIS
jgi:hypothetical protein